MSGMQLDAAQLGVLPHWVEAIPAPPAPSWIDPSSAQRGQAIFGRADGGCAATIADRFGACATPKHGDISMLAPQDLVDLGAYLETL
jgi:hypothetical protein